MFFEFRTHNFFNNFCSFSKRSKRAHNLFCKKNYKYFFLDTEKERFQNSVRHLMLMRQNLSSATHFFIFVKKSYLLKIKN